MYQPFSRILLEWYNPDRRALPWKITDDPYKIWLSEIILQQTRVEQGLPYYECFIAAFPTVKELADADIDKILKLWEGLGYYSRARNLHLAAKQIVEKYNGIFPDSYADIRSLKGVGDYTAAAIASFAFGQPYAVVDGNVYRVLSRFFAIRAPVDSVQGKKLFAKLANELLPADMGAVFNQAIMDFGALVCTPRNPLCRDCPMSPQCQAYQSGDVLKFPVKEKKITREVRYFNYLIPVFRGKTIIRQRPHGDIWAGLYEFPLRETDKVSEQPVKLFSGETGIVSMTPRKDCLVLQQELTHRRIIASFTVADMEDCKIEGRKVPLDQLQDYAFPKIIRQFLHYFSILGNK